ncbi:MAG TPA: hypothetical protein VLK27_00635 [Chthoniobacterales bacterium]|nr:hypothetical protein [Chthoniobacterales bacterium]
MKNFKSQLMLIMAIVALSAAPLVHATSFVPNGTYTFTATDGDTPLDGSWVTFSNDVIVKWYLQDSAASGNGVPTDIPLTTSNSSVVSQGAIAPNEWYFTIDGNNIATQPFDSFEGDNNVITPGAGHLFDGFGDPTGIWSAAASTPDSGSSLGLLTLALGGIVGMRWSVRRPVLSTK